MYERTPIPTDGSDGARTAFEHALGLADRFEADLHVVDAVDPATIPPEVGAERVLDPMREAGCGTLEEFRQHGEPEGLAVVSAPLDGHPHDAILSYVDDHDVDLVVTGTHGRTGPGRWFLGSVTDRVVRTRPVPVSTVRAPAEDEEA